MTVARASATFGRTVLRQTAAQTRTRAWRQLSRRQYASGGHAKKSSDLPWMIGSVVFTVPAAVWLLGQAPKKSDHHGPSHESHGKEEEAEEPAEESQEEEQPEEDSKSDDSSDDAKTEKTEDSEDESKDDAKEEKKDSKKEESKDDKEDEDKDDKDDSDESKKDKDGLGKGPGEGQKVGTRKPTETKGEKDSASDHSGAQNPYLDDDEKSKKGEGLKDTMKIHGTVKSDRPLSKKDKSSD